MAETALSISAFVVVWPRLSRSAPLLHERSTPIASSTCEGSIAPLAHARQPHLPPTFISLCAGDGSRCGAARTRGGRAAACASAWPVASRMQGTRGPHTSRAVRRPARWHRPRAATDELRRQHLARPGLRAVTVRAPRASPRRRRSGGRLAGLSLRPIPKQSAAQPRGGQQHSATAASHD